MFDHFVRLALKGLKFCFKKKSRRKGFVENTIEIKLNNVYESDCVDCIVTKRCALSEVVSVVQEQNFSISF